MGLAASNASSKDGSDLSDEQVEEISMLTSLPVKEIQRIRRKYRSLAQHEEMTKDEFCALQAIAANPLRDRLFKTLELSRENTIPFAEFAKFVFTFSYHSSKDTKLQAAFRIHDFDGDGRVSRADLRAYLELVYPRVVGAAGVTAAESDATADEAETNRREELELLVSRVMEEASSDPGMEVLLYEDFVKVIQSTDFESRLVIPF